MYIIIKFIFLTLSIIRKWIDFFHFNDKFYLAKYVQNIIILICIPHKIITFLSLK